MLNLGNIIFIVDKQLKLTRYNFLQ